MPKRNFFYKGLCELRSYPLTLVLLIAGTPLFSSNSPEPDLASKSKEHRSEVVMLAVDKTTLQAELRGLSEGGKSFDVLGRFRIAIGKEKGDKVKKGDNRTPEGIYFSLNHIKEGDLLVSKYGKSAINLNYPNPMDKLANKTGYGIWLHGAGNDDRIASENVTEGCVAFYNADILKLTSWLQPQHGIVVIAEDLKEVNKPSEQEAVLKATQDWAEGWKQRNLDSYMSAYSEGFAAKNGGKAGFRSYKARVFRSYQKMDVKMTLLHVVTHPKYALSLMNQEFSGDKRLFSKGRKMLYWIKEHGAWKIYKEEFDRYSVDPMEFSLEDLKKLGDAHSSLVVN
ncbi:MAG: L,D-transpeptidase family protein [Oligoflexales bacterium]|nr:L,D-transpeptidase family protein [Oligoflexales bacterium]